MTTIINNISDSFRELGHETDVISIFGRSQYRIVQPKLTKKTDQALSGRPGLTLLLYWLSKIIIGYHFYLSFLKRRYDLVIAADYSSVNIAWPLKKLFDFKLIHYASGGVVDFKFQKK
jgi:hypothetical protein